MEIAVVGSPEFVLGFKLAGIRKTYPVEKGQLQSKVEEILKDDNIGIMVMLDSDMKSLPSTLRMKLSESIEPVVIPIGKEEETDLRDKIKQAVGVDLWSKE